MPLTQVRASFLVASRQDTTERSPSSPLPPTYTRRRHIKSATSRSAMQSSTSSLASLPKEIRRMIMQRLYESFYPICRMPWSDDAEVRANLDQLREQLADLSNVNEASTRVSDDESVPSYGSPADFSRHSRRMLSNSGRTRILVTRTSSLRTTTAS